MAEDVVQFRKSEVDQLVNSIIETSGGNALKLSYLAAAIALEQYADALENAEINAPSRDCRRGAEAALMTAANGARRLAQSLRGRNSV